MKICIKNDKLEYLKTKEGLIKAFNNTIILHCVATTDIFGELYICVRES